jgi:hypothetical protein
MCVGRGKRKGVVAQEFWAVEDYRRCGGGATGGRQAADAFMTIVFELLEQLYHSASPEGNRADGFSEQPWRISRLAI